MKRKRILVVDDQSEIRLLIKQQLSHDYDVLEAADGKRVFDIVVDDRPDLVLLDLMMPGKDGYATLKDLKSNPRTKNIPVVIISGVDFPLNKVLAAQFGAQGYLTKPFSSAELIAQLTASFGS